MVRLTPRIGTRRVSLRRYKTNLLKMTHVYQLQLRQCLDQTGSSSLRNGTLIMLAMSPWSARGLRIPHVVRLCDIKIRAVSRSSSTIFTEICTVSSRMADVQRWLPL